MKDETTNPATKSCLRHGDLKRLALLLHITPRGLRKRRAKERVIGPPRPAHRVSSCAPLRSIALEVIRAWRKLTAPCNGWRTLMAEALRAGFKLAPTWVQWLVRELKAKRARRGRRRRDRERMHTEVLARDALWSCDESHLTRDEQGEVRALAVRETHARSTPWLSVGPPVQASDLVHALKRTAARRGGWCLVLCLDNGGANRSQVLASLCEREQVILLFNVPHTPQHNAFVERAFGELKCACGLAGRGAPALAGEPGSSQLRDALEQRLCAARDALDNTPRWSLGAATPNEIDRSAPRADHLVCRERFYRDARDALARVTQQQLSPRARRRAEREAVWSTLQAHGLVDRNRGGRQSSTPSKRNLVA